MTTLIQDVQALLNPLAAGGAWYAINTQQPPVYPYIAWQRIVSVDNVSLTGPSNLQNNRLQIDIYSLQISEADTILNAVDAAFATSALSNVPLNSQDLYDDTVKAFRVMREYSVWASN